MVISNPILLRKKKRVMTTRITEERNTHLHQLLLKKSKIMKLIMELLVDQLVWKMEKLKKSTCVLLIFGLLLLSSNMVYIKLQLLTFSMASFK